MLTLSGFANDKRLQAMAMATAGCELGGSRTSERKLRPLNQVVPQNQCSLFQFFRTSSKPIWPSLTLMLS